MIQRADGFILATPHEEYKGLAFANSPRTSPKDTRRIDKVCVDVWGLHAPLPELLEGKPQVTLSENCPTIMVTGSNGFIAGYVVQVG
ncbi:hypothetical protein EON65_08430 [archaeon]|nr:MAG: hypothetical protein EON65_08430 [archaeon]